MKGFCAATFAIVVTLGTNAHEASNALDQPSPTSQWVFVGDDGRLLYQALPKGDTIMDFSTAGYRSGGVALPNVPVAASVDPSGAGDSDAIQAAIDAVSALDPDG